MPSENLNAEERALDHGRLRHILRELTWWNRDFVFDYIRQAERAAREERDREWIAGISAGIAAVGASVFVCYGKHAPEDTAGLIEDLVTVAQMDATSVAESKGRAEAFEEGARWHDGMASEAREANEANPEHILGLIAGLVAEGHERRAEKLRALAKKGGGDE
jgi:hypothetical protein